MKYERFKSILLIILVISSIVLTGNKWFNEELWPGGYTFFSGIRNLFTGGDDVAVSFNPNEQILKPSKIIINNSGNHTLYTKSSDNYNDLYDELHSILSLGISSDKFEKCNISEWNSNLQSKSCYFAYPVTYDSGYFSSQLSSEYSGGFECFKEFLVLNDIRIPSVMHLYIKDAYSEDIQKTRINFDSASINTAIDKSKNSDNDINYYSFELNFDSNSDNAVEQPVVIAPDVLISISPKYIPAISENRLFYNIHENDILYNNILSLFEYNTSNIRKYIESDNTMVFVENYSTLKMHSNDILEYKSLNDNKGIKLNTNSIYDCLNSCITFVYKVTEALNLSDEMYFEISSDIDEISSKSFKMTFDYYLNDNMIAVTEEKFSIPHAIVVEVTNGVITSYRQICRTFNHSDETILCSSAIEAIDRIPTDEIPNSNISDIFLAYSYNMGTHIWEPVWYIEDADGELYTILSGGQT